MTIEQALNNMWALHHYAKTYMTLMVEPVEMAIEALRAQQGKEKIAAKCYNTHEVAEILAEVVGDDCACNVNGNDEWLPKKCELQAACPSPVGVACWEQYLKHHHNGRESAKKTPDSRREFN